MNQGFPKYNPRLKCGAPMAKKYLLNLNHACLLSLTGCSTTIDNAMSNNDRKFEWLATRIVSNHYPMEIICSIFMYHREAE